MQAFLDRLRRDCSLEDAEIAAVAASVREVVAVGADCDLVRQGDRPEYLHVLLEGWACRYVLLADGRRQIPALLLPGDLCDIDALTAARLDFSVGTLTPCQVARLSKAALGAAFETHPRLNRAFLALALAENAILMRWNVSLGRLSAREQVAHLLCELAARLEEQRHAANETDFVIPLTQAELADVLGLSTVHVNRVLQGLRADGLIELTGDRLRLPDRASLASAAGFQPHYLGAPSSFGSAAVS